MTDSDIDRAIPDVEIHFLNVGQGDATLIVDHNQHVAAVIDCNREGEKQVELLLRDASAYLEAAFVSHFHADHFDAIPNIVGRRETTAVYCNRAVTQLGSREQRAIVRAFMRWLAGEKAKGRPRDTLDEGAEGSVGLITWRCLAPTTELLDSAAGHVAENRASIVLLLTLPSLTILIGADADAPVWLHLLNRHPGAIDILRVPHHGGPLLPLGLLEPENVLTTYQPKIRVVSVGTENRYGHADPRWLSASEGSRVLCTQVTRACHGPPITGSHACAGTVTVQWWKSGSWRVLPESAAHLPIVKGWDHPRCISSATAQQPT